jgi:hypothetical protein
MCFQIEPGSLKNFAAQLKEGARTARFQRPQFFPRRPYQSEFPTGGGIARSEFLFFLSASAQKDDPHPSNLEGAASDLSISKMENLK